MRSTTLSIICGELVAGLVAYLHFDVAMSLAVKLGAVVFWGAVGGASGMAGKEIFTYLLNKINSWRQRL